MTQVLIPSIDAAAITPKPVNINAKFKISVTVTEETKILEPYFYYSGDIYSGEVE